MPDKSEVLRRIVEQLSRTAAASNRVSPITCDTEVYHDLRIYGDDLFELIMWLHREFGLRPDLRLADYAPTERTFGRLWQLVRKVIGRSEPQYRSLKVRDIVAAVEARRWPDAGNRDASSSVPN
jgi:hypothetical protein